MNKIDYQIKDSFTIYKELKDRRKTVLTSPINVENSKSRHPSFIVGRSPVSHKTIDKSLIFEVEVKLDNSKNFKFKLFCCDIFQKPFFRYDSAGATHRNNDPDIPLKNQQISPPHFHEFNNKGIEIAFKTTALKSREQLAKLQDINLCIMHFCEQANLRYNRSEFPEIALQRDELGLIFTNNDPLKNVRF